MHVLKDEDILKKAPLLGSQQKKEFSISTDALARNAQSGRLPSAYTLTRRQMKFICRAISLLTAEMVLVAGGAVPCRRERRRHQCHVRQIAMYICHVTLCMKQTHVGEGFGRDRSTVAHACAVVEDRRDDKAYDAFLSSLERAAASVYGMLEVTSDE